MDIDPSRVTPKAALGGQTSSGPEMELLVASAIGVLTAGGVYLVLRLRTFPVIIGMSLLTYAVNVFLFTSGRLVVGAPPILTDGRPPIPTRCRRRWC
jgi:hypothetical protein